MYAGKGKDERGVGLILEQDMKKCLLGYYQLLQILVVKLRRKPFNIFIIIVYTLTAQSMDEEIERLTVR